MTTGKIQWQQDPQNPQEGVSTTLTLNCRADGSIHMETPSSQGGFSSDYSSPEEAAQGLVSLFEEGITKADEQS